MNACQWMQKFGPLLGRLMLANLFVVSGYKKIGGFDGTLGYMTAKMPALDPMLVKLLLMITIVIELGGGLMLLLGLWARSAAMVIFLFLIPVTYVFHAYWGLTPDAMQMQFIQFHKNLAIMGGLLLVVAYGSGPYSLMKEKC